MYDPYLQPEVVYFNNRYLVFFVSGHTGEVDVISFLYNAQVILLCNHQLVVLACKER